MIFLGFVIAFAFIFFGIRFTFYPIKMVEYLQRMKFKETGQVDKRAKIVSIIMGVLLLIAGLYYLAYVILAIIYSS